MTRIVGPQADIFVNSKLAKRDIKGLPKSEKRALVELVKEMKKGSYTPGRDLKQRKGNRKGQQKVWSARLSRQYRATFLFEKSKATVTFQRIGPHHIFD